MLFPILYAHAEHVFDKDAYAQYLDIAQLNSEKISFEFDGTPYDIYYGYHGSLDAMGDAPIEPTLTDMSINQDRKSIEINFGTVPEKNNFWVRIPFEVLTAEKEQYKVLINGEETSYDLMKMPEGYVIGMIIDKETTNVEIIGSHVIPEFGTTTLLVLSLAIIYSVIILRNSHLQLKRPRIN